jgi:hypothetical protein
MDWPGLLEGGTGVVTKGACGGVSSMKGGMAAVMAFVAAVRVGVSAAVVPVVGGTLPCAGARRPGRGIANECEDTQESLFSAVVKNQSRMCHDLPEVKVPPERAPQAGSVL